MKKHLKWIMVLAWLIIIFVFSNQPAVISDGNSKFVIKMFEFLGLNLNSIWGDLANFIIRKLAHFLEYLILYMLLFNASYNKFNFKKAIIISLLGVVLYACSDEIHQLYVPGRASRVRDMIIDTSGGVLGALIEYVYIKSKQNKFIGGKGEKS